MADEVKADWAWIRRLVERQRPLGGHCGESTGDRIDRDRLDDRVDRALALIASASSPPTLPDGWRERVARIIDPGAWRAWDKCGAYQLRTEDSLSKADAIGEVFGGSVACSAEPSLASRVSDNGPAMPSEGDCVHCGTPLETGPWGFTDCPACNPNPARA